jgi:hypothetical protein
MATFALVTLACTTTAVLGEGDERFLAGEALSAAFAGATLIGSNWAEYYAPDGAIIGKVRYLGVLRQFTGRWSIRQDQVCFEYERPQFNTCSRFRRLGDRMRHFGADGRPKADGESRRLPGNRLDEFR